MSRPRRGRVVRISRHLFAIAFLGLVTDYGLVAKLPESVGKCVAPWFDPETSWLDEIITYALAFVGIYSQVTAGFSLDFPFNIVLMPLSLIEWFLRYQITFTSAPHV